MTRQFLANYTMMCILPCHELMITCGKTAIPMALKHLFYTTICSHPRKDFIAIYSSFEVSVPKASSNNSAKNGVVTKEIKIQRTALRFFLVAKKPTRT